MREKHNVTLLIHGEAREYQAVIKLDNGSTKLITGRIEKVSPPLATLTALLKALEYLREAKIELNINLLTCLEYIWQGLKRGETQSHRPNASEWQAVYGLLQPHPLLPSMKILCQWIKQPILLDAIRHNWTFDETIKANVAYIEDRLDKAKNIKQLEFIERRVKPQMAMVMSAAIGTPVRLSRVEKIEKRKQELMAVRKKPSKLEQLNAILNADPDK